MINLLCGAAILLAATTTAFSTDPGYESPDALLKAVRESIEKKSKDDLLKCSCVARLTEKLKARFEATTPAFMTYEMELITIRPGAEDPFAGFEGFEYNLKYKGVIEVKYKGMEKPVPMPYGDYKGRYYLATMVKKGTFKD